ncbi:UNVERIFIED_CONTAM: helix-turn-helix domain-containing protein [Halobacillus marinus]
MDGVTGKTTGIDVTLDIVCGKWKGLILWQLLHIDSIRFNELRRSIEGNISSRILTRELKMLIDDGLIERIDYGTVPPKVEYRITPYGKTTSTFLESMNRWGLIHNQISLSDKDITGEIQHKKDNSC